MIPTLFLAILEWVIAFGFVFYLLTFYFDLRMSKGMHKGDLSKERLNEQFNRPGELEKGARGWGSRKHRG